MSDGENKIEALKREAESLLKKISKLEKERENNTPRQKKGINEEEEQEEEQEEEEEEEGAASDFEERKHDSSAQVSEFLKRFVTNQALRDELLAHPKLPQNGRKLISSFISAQKNADNPSKEQVDLLKLVQQSMKFKQPQRVKGTSTDLTPKQQKERETKGQITTFVKVTNNGIYLPSHHRLEHDASMIVRSIFLLLHQPHYIIYTTTSSWLGIMPEEAGKTARIRAAVSS